MNSRSPLLQFIEQAFLPPATESEAAKYDMDCGYWRCEGGTPLINKLIAESDESVLGQTTKTATRESTDQAESAFAQTSATKARESIDRTELSVTNHAQTTITRTRESADQVESSISLFAQTKITETRESADRSERI